MFDLLTAIDRIAFYLPGGRPVYWYGIVVTLGILFAFGLFMLISYKKGIDVDFSLELFLWVVPLAVVFCRVFYVVPRIGTEYRLDSWEGFVDMINISNGGLTIIGGIFGGALGIFFCCLRNRKYTFAQVADCVVIALLLGQIIGRWGNFFNQELYGIEVTQEWMKRFPLAVYIESTGTWHYASFFYEGVLNAIGLAIALVIFFVPKKPVKRGTVMIFYVGWYGLVRGTLEFIKGTDPMTIGNTEIKMVQLICYIMFVVAVVLMILLQTGKIRFETKWFQRLCEKKKEQDLAKQLALEGGELKGEDSQADGQIDGQTDGESITVPAVQTENAEQSKTENDVAVVANVEPNDSEDIKQDETKPANKTTSKRSGSSKAKKAVSQDAVGGDTADKVGENADNTANSAKDNSAADSGKTQSETVEKPAKKPASKAKTTSTKTVKKTAAKKTEVKSDDSLSQNGAADNRDGRN